MILYFISSRTAEGNGLLMTFISSPSRSDTAWAHPSQPCKSLSHPGHFPALHTLRKRVIQPGLQRNAYQNALLKRPRRGPWPSSTFRGANDLRCVLVPSARYRTRHFHRISRRLTHTPSPFLSSSAVTDTAWPEGTVTGAGTSALRPTLTVSCSCDTQEAGAAGASSLELPEGAETHEDGKQPEPDA